MLNYFSCRWIVWSFVLVCLSMSDHCSSLTLSSDSLKSPTTELEQQLTAKCPEKCQCSRYFKVIKCMSQRLRSVPLDIPHSAVQLYLSHNLLTEIARGAFANLTNLTALSLEYNLIEKMEDGAFLGLTKLKILYLRMNQLTTLSSEVFQDLCSLSHLYLSQNKLVKIPDMRYAQKLIYLTLDNNNLESAWFPGGFRNLTLLSTVMLSINPKLTQIKAVDFAALSHASVRKVAVSRCGLKDIEEGVFNFPRLQSAVLSYNTGWNESFIRRVFSLFANCSELTSLDLSGVISLSVLPADIFESLAAVPLLHLSLAHTAEIAVLDNGTFQYFPMLEKLDLSNSEFSIIQDSMSQMKNLKTLTLSQNKQLKMVPSLNLPSLQLLDLSSCSSLEELKQLTFLHLPVLSTLIMHNCGIHKIYKDAFRGLDQLEKLDLSNNLVGSSSLPVDLFSPLIQLSELDLSNNNLQQIVLEKDLFADLTTLTTLDLSGNKCSMIPEEIFQFLTALSSLNLSRNRLGGSVISDSNGGKLLFGLGALERLELMENNIRGFPEAFFDSLLSLRVVNLSSNQLDGWNGSAFNASTNLLLIDFSGNSITAVPKESVVSLASNVKLNLSGNPFACWCDLIWFREWITARNITDEKLPGLDTYKCSSPLAMANKPVLDFDPKAIAKQCTPLPWIYITAGVGSFVAIIIVFVVSVCYKYRWPIRLNIYRMKKRLRGEPGYVRVDEETENRHHDVYVSYGPSTGDDSWVAEILMAAIDVKERARRLQTGVGGNDDVHENSATAGEFRGFNVYWEKRDMLPGVSEIGAVADAIYESRKVILVVSLDFVKDGRRRSVFENTRFCV